MDLPSLKHTTPASVALGPVQLAGRLRRHPRLTHSNSVSLYMGHLTSDMKMGLSLRGKLSADRQTYNNGLFYALFLQTRAQNTVKTNVREHAHTHTQTQTHTHTHLSLIHISEPTRR